MQKQFAFDDQFGIPLYTATSKLIQTTFISSKACDTIQENVQTIHEEPDGSILQDQLRIKSSPNNRPNPSKSLYESTESTENENIFQVTSPTEENIPTTTFDYLYEFSETRKVLEEFFKCPENDKIKELGKFSDLNESDDSLVSDLNLI